MKPTLPHHIGFIVDGNRRWARERGLTTFQGHKRGYERMKDVADWVFAREIPVASFWIFSTENWKRSKTEVRYLMNMVRRLLMKEVDELMKKGIQLRVTGRLDNVDRDIKELFEHALARTANNARGILNLVFNYGGQEEMVDMVKKILEIRPQVRMVTKDLLQKYIYSPDLPDVDFVVRTSGELRTSGFLLWQATYAEYLFPKRMWPAFSEHDLDEALKEFARRNRRFGGNDSKNPVQ
ncbi:MAG: di-trans,poly-cis-decaprenylcistransferase [Candidatus Kerfeldbacteria bacterium]|nr:di-trans,poly-cis-decaprenylcistransferase [Candidatus Kerfeldbacteria bacterium]